MHEQSAKGEKPRLLLIGHSYMLAINREKAKAFAAFFEVCVCTMDFRGVTAYGREAYDEDDPKHEGFYVLKRLERLPKSRQHTQIVFKGLGDVLRDYAPDIIMVDNEPWSFMRWQSRLLAWLYARKALFAEFTWENIRRRGFKGEVLDWVYRAAVKTNDVVICGNQAAAELFERAGQRRECIMVDGHLGIGEEEFPSASDADRKAWREGHSWSADSRVIGYCGRLVEEKGLRELAGAVQSLRRTFPNLKLALLGHGPLGEELQAMDPDKRWLAVLPPVPQQQVGEFLNKLDIFVLPSKPLDKDGHVWKEQFGHVLIEAITAGCLVFGSSSGAIPEVLGCDDLVFRHSSQNALTEILHRYLASPELTGRTKEWQREDCLSRWSHDRLAGRYAGFLISKWKRKKRKTEMPPNEPESL